MEQNVFQTEEVQSYGPDDFDTPYRPAESIRLPFREADFPIIMRQLLAASPANRKVPIFISTLSPLGALATRLRVKYPYDIMLHAILLQTIIEAPPSTGKRCFAEVVRQIIEPTLEARDKQQRRLEQEYREKKNARAQNEKIGQDTYTDEGQLQPVQVMDTSWLDAAVDRFSSQTAKRVLEMKTAWPSTVATP